MSPFWVGFIVGFFVGGLFGLLVLSLLFVASDPQQKLQDHNALEQKLRGRDDPKANSGTDSVDPPRSP